MLNDLLQRLKSDDDKLKVARLGGKQLGLDGIRELFDALQSNSYLEDLDVSDNGLSVKCVNLLARCLIANSHLRVLNLSNNDIGAAGAEQLVEPMLHNETVERLLLNNCSLGSRGGRLVAEVVHFNNSLTDLDLTSNALTAWGVAEVAAALPNTFTLYRLRLGFNQLEDRGLKSLANGLMSNKSVRVLDLSNNSISPKGIKQLMVALEDISSPLEVLDLSNNFVAPEGCRDIMEHLPHLRALHVLNLRNNELGDTGLFYVRAALCDPSRGSFALYSLDVSENQVTATGMKFLADVLDDYPHLYDLDITGNAIGEAGGAHLVDTLVDNRSLVTLYYGNTDVSAEQSKVVQEAIQRNRQQAGLPPAGGASKRTRTRPRFGGSLPGLDFDEPHLSALDLARLCGDRHCRLGSLRLNGVALARELAACLLRNRTLHHLDLSGNKLRLDEAQVLASALSHLPLLEILNVSSNFLGEAGIRPIAIFLAKAPSLTRLDVSNNDIGNLGLEDVALALPRARCLGSLSLEWNALTAMDQLAEAVAGSTTLTELFLAGNPLRDAGVTALCTKGLAANRSLRTLDLSLTLTKAPGAEALIAMLETNDSLTHVALGRNVVPPETLATVGRQCDLNRAAQPTGGPGDVAVGGPDP